MNAPNPKSAYQATTQKTAHSDTPAILTPEALALTDAYWRAANYLSVGQIYPYDNPLLREPLTQAHVKPLVVGQWGTTRARISSTSISIAS